MFITPACCSSPLASPSSATINLTHMVVGDGNGQEYTKDSKGAVAVTRLGARYDEMFAFIISIL